MKTKDDSPIVVEVGKAKIIVAQRRGLHTNIIVRPTHETLRQAAKMARLEYGPGSQTERCILARLEPSRR